MTKKTSKDNPIKRITLDSNVASAIVTQIAIALNVKLHTDKDEDGNILGVSAYIGNCIRLADHKTYLQTWVDNGMWDAPYRISIVIEDEETIGKTQVKEGYDFEVLEYIFKSQMMTPQKAREIAFDIKQARETGRFANNGGGQKFTLKSVYNTLNKVQQNISMNCINDAVPANRYNHGADFVSESKNNKTNKNESKNMNKKNTIRLTESELKRIITESVKKVMSENEEIIDEGLFDNIRDTYHDMVTSRVNPEKYQRYRQNRNYQDAMNAQQQGTNLSASQKGTLRRGDEKLAQRKANTQKMLTRARSEYIDTENGRSNPYRTDATARTAQRARTKYQTYQNRNNDIQGNNNPY